MQPSVFLGTIRNKDSFVPLAVELNAADYLAILLILHETLHEIKSYYFNFSGKN